MTALCLDGILQSMETPQPKYTVSALTLNDYAWSVEVAGVRMILEEVGRPEILNRQQLYLLVDQMIAGGTALIAHCDGKPVGALGSILTPNLFNPQIITLAEVIWYVLPEYRNTRAGYLLLKGFDNLAEKLGADESVISLLNSSKVSVEGLAKRGYVREEQAFRKRIKEY
jgi:hypothetical protein